MRSRSALQSSLRRLTQVLAAALVLVAGPLSVPARAGVANAGIPGAPGGDPLAGMPWGNYSGQLDEVFPAYRSAQGEARRLLGMIALRPRMRWFGSWYADNRARSVAREYIDNVTQGNPNVLSQMAVFRLVPWEGTACVRLPTPAEQASYKTWIDEFAAGIGSARVALVLQPDLPFASCVPGRSPLPLQLVSYAARRFSALPHTTVYIDVGSADWVNLGQAAGLLSQAGVRYARGFALNGTHYDSTEREIMFAGKLARALGARGIRHKRAVINTAANGRPFTYQQYHGPDFDNAAVCPSRASARCVTLGIPPTADVTNPRWGLSSGARAIAAIDVDAFVWLGRPWLVDQADPFDLQRTLELARTTPFS